MMSGNPALTAVKRWPLATGSSVSVIYRFQFEINEI